MTPGGGGQWTGTRARTTEGSETMATLMATGYVHEMLDKKQDFPTFAMQCARAFGALITMRDEPADVPIPDQIEPDSYYAKALVTARADLSRLTAMDEAAQLAYGEQAKKAAIGQHVEYHGKRLAEVGRVRAMVAEVQKWTPPTPEHEGLKKFMLEQLERSVRYEDDSAEKELADLRKREPLTWYTAAVTDAHRSIARYIEEVEKERRRAESRTKWIQELRTSLARGG